MSNTQDNGRLLSTFNYLVPAAGTTNAFSCRNVVAAGDAIDFSQVTAQSGLPFNPSGLQVDNINGSVPAVFTIVQTGFSISVPVGKQQGIQFPAPAGFTVQVTCNGANFAFVDYPVIPYQF